MAVDRMCAVCRSVCSKEKLLRITRNSAGDISVDLKGKLPGRGMYICRHGDCVKLARKRRVLERAYKVSLKETEDIYCEIEKIFED